MRPKPIITLEHRNEDYDATQVILAEGIYALCYKGQPINIRTMNILVNYPGPKYMKSSFGNSAHAFNKRDKLNEMFNCKDFTVVLMTLSKIVERDIQPKSTQKRHNSKDGF